MTSDPPGEEERLAHAAATRSARLHRIARLARDQAAASGTLVWDPFDPEWRRDPYPAYARLVAENPVHRSPLGFWVFTRHADCLSVLRDRRASSEGPKNKSAQFLTASELERAPGTPMGELSQEMAPFLFLDPPRHDRLRGLVQKAFTPRVVADMAPRIAQICDELLDAARDREEMDLVADFAYPLPVQVIAEMLGVPAEDHVQFREWAAAFGRGLDPDFLLPREVMIERSKSVLAFARYFEALIDERRTRPGDDLISGLIRAEEEGNILTRDEVIGVCMLLLVAGHETTVTLISGGTLALVEHPDQQSRFRDDPSVLRTGVEEMIRWTTPVQFTSRVALDDVEWGGVPVKRDDLVMVLLAAANRDPGVFPSPQTFDVARADNPHLGFGFGVHHCLGAPLGRLEAQVALGALMRRTSDLALVGEELTYNENFILRGLSSLPISCSWRPERAGEAR